MQTHVGSALEHCVNVREVPRSTRQLALSLRGCIGHVGSVHADYDAASLTLVSGTAGMVGAQQRQARREKDQGLAHALLAQGLPAFVQAWYQQPMWQSLRLHAR